MCPPVVQGILKKNFSVVKHFLLIFLINEAWLQRVALLPKTSCLETA
jgi:hypothetical protein